MAARAAPVASFDPTDRGLLVDPCPVFARPLFRGLNRPDARWAS